MLINRMTQSAMKSDSKKTELLPSSQLLKPENNLLVQQDIHYRNGRYWLSGKMIEGSFSGKVDIYQRLDMDTQFVSASNIGEMMGGFYDGEWQKGVPHGIGRLEYSLSRIHLFQAFYHYRTGKDYFSLLSSKYPEIGHEAHHFWGSFGRIYEGEFCNGLPHGKGNIFWDKQRPDKTVYELKGEFQFDMGMPLNWSGSDEKKPRN